MKKPEPFDKASAKLSRTLRASPSPFRCWKTRTVPVFLLVMALGACGMREEPMKVETPKVEEVKPEVVTKEEEQKIPEKISITNRTKEFVLKKLTIPQIKNPQTEMPVFDKNGKVKFVNKIPYGTPNISLEIKYYDENGNEVKNLKSALTTEERQNLKKLEPGCGWQGYFVISPNKELTGRFFTKGCQEGGMSPVKVRLYDNNGNIIINDVDIPEEISQYGFGAPEFIVSNKVGELIFFSGEQGIAYVFNMINKKYKKLTLRQGGYIDTGNNWGYEMKGSIIEDGERYAFVTGLGGMINSIIYALVTVSDRDGNILWQKNIEVRTIRSTPLPKFSKNGEYLALNCGMLFNGQGKLLHQSDFVDNDFSEDDKYFYFVMRKTPEIYCFDLKNGKIKLKSDPTFDKEYNTDYTDAFKLIADKYIIAIKPTKKGEAIVIYNNELKIHKVIFPGSDLFPDSINYKGGNFINFIFLKGPHDSPIYMTIDLKE